MGNCPAVCGRTGTSLSSLGARRTTVSETETESHRTNPPSQSAFAKRTKPTSSPVLSQPAGLKQEFGIAPHSIR